jgi:hypothetical protein
MSVQVCATHLQRPAYARCMTCSRMLCQECATQWDGIWHCAGCLGAKRGSQVERSPVLSWLAVISSSVILLYAGARAMVWAGAILASLF